MHRSLVRAVVLVVLVGVVTPAAVGGATAQEQTTVTVTVVDQAGDRVGDVDLTVVWNDGEGSENVTTRANGQVLVACDDGKLYCFGPRGPGEDEDAETPPAPEDTSEP